MLFGVRPEDVESSNVNLHIAQLFKLEAEGTIDIDNNQWPEAKQLELPYELQPGEYALAKTIESIDQKTPKYHCLLGARSRAYRIGLSIKSNFFGPYYKGEMVFGIKNEGTNPVMIRYNTSLTQICFLPIKGDTNKIEHVYMHGRIV